MTIEEDDAATAFLKQLIQEHPEATDDELWELFRPVATNSDEIKAAIKKFHTRQLN
jgi:hypothetical protein